MHAQDEQACTFDQQLDNLRHSGLSAQADIDGAQPPYGDAHVLVTNAPGGKSNSALAHLGLVFDFTLPRRQGQNRLAPAWRYMLTADTGTAAS